MVVDTSSILAVLFQEADANRHAEAMETVEQPLVSAATVVEAGLVLTARHGPEASALLWDFLREGGFQIEPVTTEQATLALEAFANFGKGRGHPAGLNYGDCFAYALAKAMGAPLLFKGKDFAHTDIAAA